MRETGELTAQEQRLRIALTLLALLSGGFAVFYVVNGLFGDSQYPFVANSATKDGLLVVLCLVGIADIRRYSWTVPVLIAAHGVLIAANVAMAIAGNVDDISATLSGPGMGAHATLWVWIGADAAIVVLFTALYESAQRARYGLRYLGSAEFRTLAALAEVLVGGKEPPVAPETIAKFVDDYLSSFRAYGKGKIRAALFALSVYPLFSARAPFSIMSPQLRRRFVEKRFVDAVEDRMTFAFKRMVIQSLIRAAQQMVFLGYYSQPEVAESVGYLPFSRRSPETAKKAEEARKAPRAHPALRCIPPAQIAGDTMRADIVIVGSGAAGATLAYHLLERHPDRTVTILERGAHVDRSEFTESEADQLAKLYVDGALTMSRDFRFQVAQGMCVGGSTVVNNAVCLDMPEQVLDRWVDPDGLNSGLEAARVRASFKAVREWLPVVAPVTDRSHQDTLNPSWPKFVDGVEKLGLERQPYDFTEVDCNVEDCLGSGYCNIGCPYGKKLSMLDNVLPRAQREFGDRLRIIERCRAVRIDHDGRRASGVVCRLMPEGEPERTFRVSAKTVISSAGAIASSVLLARSGAGDRSLVGRNLAFNMGSPLTGDFEEPLHSERGLQISHVLQAPPEKGMALELWFNPVVAQSLFMPGWFEDHYRNMQRYAHMMCIGTVVGTAGNARVKPTLFGTRGVTFDYTPTRGDMSRLVEGLKLAGKVMLAAGAKRVMPSTFALHEFHNERQLDVLDRYVRDDGDLSVNSAHPQGGNNMSRDPARGVVGPDFRVHGFSNVYACDASVFPSSITVNPQLTVMALAHYASSEIAGS